VATSARKRLHAALIPHRGRKEGESRKAGRGGEGKEGDYSLPNDRKRRGRSHHLLKGKKVLVSGLPKNLIEK